MSARAVARSSGDKMTRPSELTSSLALSRRSYTLLAFAAGVAMRRPFGASRPACREAQKSIANYVHAEPDAHFAAGVWMHLAKLK